MKKIIAMLLAIVMVLGLFAACGTKPVETDPPKSTQGNTDKQPEGTESSTSNWKEEHPTWLCEEKTTLVIHTHDSDGAGVIVPSNDQGFWKALEEYTNVHIEWNLVPYADYTTVLQTRMGAGEYMGDIVNTGDLSTAYTAGQNGLFIEMSDLYKNYMPFTQAHLAEKNINMDNYWINPDGSMYGISSINNADGNHPMILWNTLWLEKIGMDIPETDEEVYAVLSAMKAAGDLNGNGEADEIYLSSMDWAMILSESFMPTMFGLEGWSMWAADENGKAYYSDTTENFKAMMKYANKLYSEGLIDPELFAGRWDWDRLTERLSQDRVGAVIVWSSFAPEYGALTVAGSSDPNGEYYSLSKAMKSEWNNYNPKIMCNWSTFWAYSISTECENAELAARWMDVVMADPYVLDLRIWGEEGTHYTVNENGEKVRIVDENGVMIPVSSEEWGGGQIPVGHIQTTDQVNAGMPDWYLTGYDEYLAGGTLSSRSIPGVSFTEEERTIRDTYITDFYAYTDEMCVKFITGQVDVDAGWDEYVATCKALGLDELNGVYQSVYDRTH